MSAATDLTALAAEIEELFERATSDLGDEAAATVEEALSLLDDGSVRVAAPSDTGWHVNEWAKKAILLSFRTRGMETIEVGPYEYHDKMPLKTGWAELGVRVVPPATVRQGAYVAPGAVLMPSYVNVGRLGGLGHDGRHVGHRRLVRADRHRRPPLRRRRHRRRARAPAGHAGHRRGRRLRRLALHRGRRRPRRPRGRARRQRRAHRSTPIIDVRGEEAVELRGEVPPRAIVIPGTRKKKFPAGSYRIPCALIIGERSASTDRKTSLTEALREHAVSV